LDQAKILLVEALKKERNAEIINEIERRLELLGPKTVMQVKCRSCGKVFEPKRARRYSRVLCQGCINKRYSKSQ
jgi:uncharacterized OB-fold protein